MAHRITLIITADKVYSQLDIPHFYDNNYLIIPTDDDGWEAQMIENLSSSETSFNQIFEKFFIEFYEEDLHNGDFKDIFNKINTFEDLYILEIIEKLKIENFLIIHYSEVGFDTYQNYIGFEGRQYVGSVKSRTSFFETKINTENYWRFDSCKKRYFESLNE